MHLSLRLLSKIAPRTLHAPKLLLLFPLQKRILRHSSLIASGCQSFSTIPPHGGGAPLPKRSLDTVLKLDLIENETPQRVEEIWNEFHKDNSRHVGSTITKEKYTIMLKHGHESPLCTLPIFLPPKEDGEDGGFFVVLAQFQTNYWIVTELEQFTKLGPSATTAMSMWFYDELLDSKGLCLIRSDVMDVTGYVGPVRAFFIQQMLINLYANEKLYTKWVYPFNHDQDKFDYELFVDHCSKYITPDGNIHQKVTVA